VKEIGAFVRDVGFPAFVAVYLLWQVQPALAKLNDTLTQIQVTIARCDGP